MLNKNYIYCVLCFYVHFKESFTNFLFSTLSFFNVCKMLSFLNNFIYFDYILCMFLFPIKKIGAL